MPKHSSSQSTHHETRAILLAQQLPHHSEEEVRLSLEELRRLLAGLGISVLDSIVQRRSNAQSSAVIGAGKQEEVVDLLRRAAETHPSDDLMLVFDGELSPAQLRLLQNAVEVDVSDRTGIILRIFEKRAQTELARLEVEMAGLTYTLPRVRDDGAPINQGGGGGRGERGHSNVELRKRNIKVRLGQLKKRVEQLQADNTRRRSRRGNALHVALVGYTNAGKSSLMRALTGSRVLIEDKLFATLGTTVRALTPEVAPPVVVSDTVGFIRNLPHELVASFLATLDEALHADLLLMVVDTSDPAWRQQLNVTREVLDSIQASDIASLLVFNKLDLVDADTAAALAHEFPTALQLSAHRAEDIANLHRAITEHVFSGLESASVFLTFAEGALRTEIHQNARVIHEQHTEDGTAMQVRALPEAIRRWASTGHVKEELTGSPSA